MTSKKHHKNDKKKFVVEDGFEWIPRAGQLWGTYDTCAEYCGGSRSTFPNYVFRHGIRTIKHGRFTLANKHDLDRKSGALAA